LCCCFYTHSLLQIFEISEKELRESQREVWCPQHNTYHPAFIDERGGYYSRCGFGTAEAVKALTRPTLKSASSIMKKQEEEPLSNDDKIKRLLSLGDPKMLGLV
jgi:hypothetical protein